MEKSARTATIGCTANLFDVHVATKICGRESAWKKAPKKRERKNAKRRKKKSVPVHVLWTYRDVTLKRYLVGINFARDVCEIG